MFMEWTRDSLATFSQGSGNVAKHKPKKKKKNLCQQNNLVLVGASLLPFWKRQRAADGEQGLYLLTP